MRGKLCEFITNRMCREAFFTDAYLCDLFAAGRLGVKYRKALFALSRKDAKVREVEDYSEMIFIEAATTVCYKL
jgi:hypothetical protein